jgi:hypothetical protein
MNDVDDFDPADGVYLQGSFNGWCGICNPMSDEDGDYIYTLTISLPESPSYEYIYTTNGWDGLQGFAPLNSSCDFVPGDEFANYGFDLSGGNLILDIIPFGGCPDGGGGASVVTFDLDGVDDCGFVSVSGTFDNWSGYGATTDTNMEAQVLAGSYEFRVLCVDTTIPEWYNDIWGSSCILTAPCGSECDFDPTDEFNNYGFTIGSETTLTVSYCAGTCDATCGSTDPPYCDGDECSCDDPGCGEEDCVCESCPDIGDLNGDGGFNVLDIVSLANCVLANNCTYLQYACAADLNGDGFYNILDIVTLANCVLAINCGGRVTISSIL